MNPYPVSVRRHMKLLYDSLSEKDRRRYAAVEAEKLGHGGVQTSSGVFVGIWPITMKRPPNDCGARPS